MNRRSFVGLLLGGLTFLLPALAEAQELFVTTTTGSVAEFTTSGTFLGDFVSAGSGGLNSQVANLRFGPDGNLYVCDGSFVKEYNGTTGAYLGNFASGFQSAADIVFDSSGNAFISDYTGNAIYEFSKTGALLNTFTSGVSSPDGMAFAPNGNLLIANTYVQPYANTITELNTTTGTWSTFATGLGEPVGLAQGPDGRYYAGNYTYATSYGGTNPDTIQVLPEAGGVSTTWNQGGDLDGTDYLAFAGANLYVTSYYNDQVVYFDGATGSYLGSFSGPSNEGSVVGIAFGSALVPEPAGLTQLVLGVLGIVGFGQLCRGANRKAGGTGVRSMTSSVVSSSGGKGPGRRKGARS